MDGQVEEVWMLLQLWVSAEGRVASFDEASTVQRAKSLDVGLE